MSTPGFMNIDSNTILFVKDLRVWFPVRRGITDVLARRPPLYVRAVDSVSFEVKQGDVFALVGESGCGKTTTGKSVLMLYEVTGGQIGYKPSQDLVDSFTKLGYKPEYITEYGHIDLSKVPRKYQRPLRKEIQMIWQDPYGSLNPRLTIFEILEEPLIIHKFGFTRSDRYDMIHRALELVKLTPPEDFMNRYPHMLSGGQRQRVVIARALILNPRFIVADEPVSMLDVSIRAEIIELLLELKQKLNLTYLFITHDLAIARYIANKIAIMYLGKIVEMGDTEKVIRNPLHPYTRALISAVPEPDPSNRLKVREVPIKGEVPSAVNIPPGCRFHPRCVALDEHRELRGVCDKQEPPMVEVEPGHYVACWLYAKR
ncbi:oligopeptide/dipeptide ABC transporter, ATPase subunit [Thermogladius calderae 1633]|uniref:Oligopeptide/dipeptide ABC transporter, ATPase subunit n=2 Tax=Thermogladius calderae TaxID=1200300 RepID=I3TFP6_THEC1|nr:oligopeptide/dipeptide ABC transporter, ATPase subunit [Thermogladius calderae 1633]